MRPPRQPLRRVVLLLVTLVSLSACGPSLAARPATDHFDPLPAGTDLIRTELIFGRARPDGPLVSEEQWKAFVDQHVTPRFPDGLTILDATGQYRSRSGQLIREPSKIIILLHGAGDASGRAVQEIRGIYKRRFNQESVLLVSSIARVSF